MSFEKHLNQPTKKTAETAKSIDYANYVTVLGSALLTLGLTAQPSIAPGFAPELPANLVSQGKKQQPAPKTERPKDQSPHRGFGRRELYPKQDLESTLTAVNPSTGEKNVIELNAPKQFPTAA